MSANQPPRITQPAAPVQPPAPTLNFHEILKTMLALSDGVSDLIFSPGRPPQVELVGRLTPVAVSGIEKLLPQHTSAIGKMLIGQNEIALKNLDTTGAADVSYSIPGVARFRVNVFKQRGTIAIVMRVIPNTVPTLAELHLPLHLNEIMTLKNGIVLVTGPTGSGKSSTLAALVDLINQTYPYHIVTIEDPIEFIHPHKASTVHQRELGSDTNTFAHALRAALRQAPKVILVGEMRDLETVEVALEAAETGHLVLSTLHTTDAAKTVERIIGIFPKTVEHSIRMRLAASFRYIVSQRLIPRADGRGRIPAVEILKSTLRTRDYIERGESEGRTLLDAMRSGDIDGMQDFDTELERMIRDGLITMENGLLYSTNRHNLQLQLSDVSGGSAVSRDVEQRPSGPLTMPEPKKPAEKRPGGDSMLDIIER
jgi:twitching motility protein PilT